MYAFSNDIALELMIISKLSSTRIRRMIRSVALLALVVAGVQGKTEITGLNVGEGQLIEEARSLVAGALGSVKSLASDLGDKMKFSVEELQKDGALSKMLGDGKITIDDLVDRSVLDSIKNANTFDDLWNAFEGAASEYCEETEYTPSEKKPTSCTGPEVELELEPKICTVDPLKHEIDCTPAKLVLRKIPGKCTYKHHSPVELKGHVCKFEKKFGKEQTVTKGFGTYTTYIDKHNITKPW
jgi:hypothetical protein